MAHQPDGRICTDCGAAVVAGRPCPACGTSTHAIGTHGVELKLLPPLPIDAQTSRRPDVRLVRQLKLPTVDHLVGDRSGTVADLPEAMRSVEAALAEGDLAAADALLERALGTVLAGPGHRPRRRRRLALVPAVLCVWCALLLLLLLLRYL